MSTPKNILTYIKTENLVPCTWEEKLKNLISWFTGILDSEGSLYLSKKISKIKKQPSYGLHLRIEMTDEATINKLSLILNVMKIKHGIYGRERKEINQKNTRKLCIESKEDIEKILYICLPYVITKRHQILLGLEFLEKLKISGSGFHLEPYFNFFKIVNKKGKSDYKFKPIEYNLLHYPYYWSWLSGFFDGDGYLGLIKIKRKKSTKLVNVIEITHLDTLNFIKKIYKKNKISWNFSKRMGRAKEHKDSFTLRVENLSNLELFLKEISKYCFTKAMQVSVGTQYIKYNFLQTTETDPNFDKNNNEFLKSLAILNKRGK